MLKDMLADALHTVGMLLMVAVTALAVGGIFGGITYVVLSLLGVK